MASLFDPLLWLREFEAVGGGASLTRAGHFSTVRHLGGMTIERLERSWALQKELIDDQSKLVAVWSLMQQQRAA